MIIRALILTVFLLLTGCARNPQLKENRYLISASLKNPGVLSPVFYHPSAGGKNLSPAVQWKFKQTGKSVLLLLTDETPVADHFIHWLVFNLPSEQGLLKAGASGRMMPEDSMEWINSYGFSGYGGPAPVQGDVHQYRLTLFLLDRLIDIENPGPEGMNYDQVTKLLTGHILDEQSLSFSAGTP